MDRHVDARSDGDRVDVDRVDREVARELAVREQHARTAVGEHVRLACERIRRIDRQERGAGRHHAEHGDQHLHARVEQDADDVLAADAALAQRVCDRVRAGVHLAVGERGVPHFDRNGVGLLAHARLPQRMHARHIG